MIDSQFSLFLPSLFFISIDVWESCHKSYSQPKLPVEMSFNTALSTCHVCPRLTHLFPAGHFVTSSTLCTNQGITSYFMVTHMYVEVDFILYTNSVSNRSGVLLNCLGFLVNATEN